MKKLVVTTMVAGKLAIGVNAQATGLGKTDSYTTEITPLSLNEIGAPSDIITPPSDAGTTDSGSKLSENGNIYTQLAANQRIDFIVSGIRSDMTMQVFLAYSKGAGESSQWLPFTSGQGQLELAAETLEVLAGITIEPQQVIGPFPATDFGSMSRTSESIVLPVDLSDLSNIGEHGEMLYFQALAIPVSSEGEFQWELAQASEVDAFTIDRNSTTNNEISKTSTPDDNSSGGDSKTDGSTDSGSKM